MFSHVDKKRKYVAAMRSIDAIAVRLNIPPEDAALKVIRDNRQAVEQFVIDNGEVPESDARNLAAQALVIHEYKIWDKVKTGAFNYETAENIVLGEQQNNEDAGLINKFDASLLGTIFKAGRAALPKINAKRIAAGKKPILAGEKGQALLQKIGEHVALLSKQIPDKNGHSKQTDIGIITGSLEDQMTKEKTAAAIKKYLPYALVIVIVIFFFGKHFK